MSERTKLRAWRAQCPTSVKIGPHTYTVVCEDKAEFDEKDNLLIYGWHIEKDHTIKLLGWEEVPSRSFIAEVAIHEVFHGLWASRKITRKSGEESIVTNFGLAMTQFAMDNPEFMKWWQKGLQ